STLSCVSACSRQLRDPHSFPTRRSSDLSVVVDLDPLGPRVQAEGLAHLVQNLRLGGVLRQFAAQRLTGVGKGVVDQTGLAAAQRSEEHTSELQSRENLVCRLLLEKKKQA